MFLSAWGLVTAVLASLARRALKDELAVSHKQESRLTASSQRMYVALVIRRPFRKSYILAKTIPEIMVKRKLDTTDARHFLRQILRVF